MRFEASQSMKMGQQMRLAPRMIQSMEILAMPLQELEERISEELQSNPVLETAGDIEGAAAEERTRAEMREIELEGRELERGLDGEGGFERLDRYESDQPDASANAHDVDWRDRGGDDYEPRARSTGADDEFDATTAAASRAMPLSEQLLGQWHLVETPADVRAAGDLIIGFIEDDGLLRTDLATIADRAPVDWLAGAAGKPDVELLERALAALQLAVEPAGIGARDRRECLLLQIDAERRGLDVRDLALEDARVIVAGHLEDLAQNKLPRIAERCELPMARVLAARDRMRGLSLSPGKRLVDEASPGITPDAIIEYDEEHDRFVGFLAESRIPDLAINRQYAEMLRDRSVPSKDRDFLRTNMSNAQFLIDAIGQRRATLLRVVGKVTEHQRDALEMGMSALKPLAMTSVAEELGIHVATVSRAVSEKYVQTPRGVIALRKFFTGGLPSSGESSSGGEQSYDAVRAAVAEVVANEDKAKPLSDDAIAAALKVKGIEIARRTVAKYRDQLGIATARLRKAF